jgi:CYTH domain
MACSAGFGLRISAMNEIELKFQIPAAQVEGVRQQIQQLAAPSGSGAQTLPLHAAYFDTPDHALARQKCALRVRREGDAWVQTFKGAGADAMTRLEENRDVPPPPNGQPHPNLSCHGAEVRASLQQVLKWSPEVDARGETLGLHALYETRFERLHTLQRSSSPAGSVVVCLDEGVITAGELQSPLAELELELSEGSPSALIALAQGWVQQHRVWLDVQSKAMKGTRLARAAASGHAVSAQALHLPDGWALAFEASAPTTGEAAHVWHQPLSLCLDVAAGNWAEVAFGHLNWQHALSAWLDTLQSLQHATRANAGLAAWLGPDLLALQADLVRALSELCQAAQADTLAAQALATSAAPTLWALGVLTALQQAR